MPQGMLADLPMLGRDDIRTDGFPKIPKTAAVIRNGFDERICRTPTCGCAPGFRRRAQPAEQRPRLAWTSRLKRPKVRNELGRRGGPAGKNTGESYTVRQPD
jgi:hypothetical protein